MNRSRRRVAQLFRILATFFRWLRTPFRPLYIGPLRRFRAKQAEWRRRADIRGFLDHMVSLAEGEAPLAARSAPFVSLITPVYNTPPSYLDALLASVRRQVPGSWQLVLSDDGSTSRATRKWLSQHSGDPCVTVVQHSENTGIVDATNRGLSRATADWVAFLDHDDALTPHALANVIRALDRHPACELIYTDEVIADRNLRPQDYFLKPAFDPVLLSGVNYINHMSFYRRGRVLELGGMRKGFDGSQDYDLLLRYLRHAEPAHILHLPYPAYIWRRDGSSYSIRRLGDATRNARKALSDAYGVGPDDIGEAPGDLHRVNFHRRRSDWPLVSIVIPSRDSYALINQIISGLTVKTQYSNIEIIIVDNGTTDPRVLELYDRLVGSDPRVKVSVEAETFNFSRAVNKGVRLARGEFVLLLNNDIEILHADWLQEMVQCFSYPEVGIVGAKLLYPDGSLQHAGVIVGFGKLAGHWYVGMPETFPGPMGRLRVRQSLSSVTGACMLISRECLEKVGAFDETMFAIAYNDVDFCLRAKRQGYRIVWTPFAVLKHHESASRGSDETEANRERFSIEKANLQYRHQTDGWGDPSISPWYSTDRSYPEWVKLEKLPAARSGVRSPLDAGVIQEEASGNPAKGQGGSKDPSL